MIFKSILKFLFGFFIFAIFTILNFFLNIRIGLYPMRIGPYITVPEIYLRKKKYKSFDIWGKNKREIPNKYLDKIVSKKINFVSNIYYSSLLYFLEKIQKKKKFNYFFLNAYTRDTQNIIDNYDNIISMPEKDKRLAQNILLQNGIDIKKKIVCVHVRDSSYLSIKFPHENFSYHDRRNGDLDTYIKTINYLLSKDYIVFRMGKHVNKKLSIKNKNFIDFPFFHSRSDLLDIYLGSSCYFAISTGSGWDQIPFCFRRPVLYTNVSNISRLQLSSKKFISIFKLAKKNNNFLKIPEMLHEDIKLNFNINKKRENLNSELEYINNTEDEILEATKEMEILIKNNFNQSSILKNHLMEKFLKNYDFRNIKDYFDEMGHSDNIKGCISPSFLKKNEAKIFDE